MGDDVPSDLLVQKLIVGLVAIPSVDDVVMIFLGKQHRVVSRVTRYCWHIARLPTNGTPNVHRTEVIPKDNRSDGTAHSVGFQRETHRADQESVVGRLNRKNSTLRVKCWRIAGGIESCQNKSVARRPAPSIVVKRWYGGTRGQVGMTRMRARRP